MHRTAFLSFIALAVTAAIALAPLSEVAANPQPFQPAMDAYGVIDAVNTLRASNGLSPYTVNSTLMSLAQSHAEYMASTGSVTHTGPGGMRPYERALAAGYPLAGQIPPGFYSENIQSGGNLSPEAVVQMWTGDAPHLNTMTSPNLQEIGAGVAQSGGNLYYVIDCARPTTGGLPQAYTPGIEAAFNFANEIIVPVTLSTPNTKGEIIHEVQSGQSLWQIAIDYGVKIDEIRALNQLPTAYLINPGDTLLVKTVGTPTLSPATATSTASPPPTSTPTSNADSTEIPANPPASSAGASPTQATTATWAVGAIVTVALAAAALVAWVGRARPI
jgi:uncharacterized protein YkwD